MAKHEVADVVDDRTNPAVDMGVGDLGGAVVVTLTNIMLFNDARPTDTQASWQA